MRLPKISLPRPNLKAKLPRPNIGKLLPSTRKIDYSVRMKLYAVDTLLLFLFNQMTPSGRKKPTTPLHFSSMDKLFESPRSEPGTIGTTFHLLAWNIQMGYLQKEVLRDFPEIKTEIMLLQEVPVLEDDELPLLANTSPFFSYAPNLFVKKRSKRYDCVHRGQLTLTSVAPLDVMMFPLTRVTMHNNHQGKQSYGKQVALYTKLRTAHGTLGIYNLHLENQAKASGRQQQLQEVIDHAQAQNDTYLIIAGDMNTILGSAELSNIVKKAGLQRAKTGPTRGLFTFDHIYHSHNIRVSAKVISKQSSDHNPIVAEVTLLP